MARDIEELRDFTRAVGDWAKRHLQYDSWNPVKAALLLSGIEPSARWSDFVELEKQDDGEPIACGELFAKVHSTLEKPERGADGKPVFKDSVRLLNAEIILKFWDDTCNFQKLYPVELDPKSFVGWLFRAHQRGSAILHDSMWLYVFVSYSGTESPFRVLPRELLDERHEPAPIDETLLPKHKFRAEIVQAWNEARKAGAGENDPDAILSRLADMMKRGKIEGVELQSYSRKSDITYKISGVVKPKVLLRSSFARQLRRMNQSLADREASQSKPSGHVSLEGDFPVIARVPVEPKMISQFTGDEKLMKLARDLLWETTTYVTLAAGLQIFDSDWPRETAVLVGNMVRLSKLLISVRILAEGKSAEMLALTVPLAIESVVDLKYLIANFNSGLIGSYVESPEKREQGAELDWASLDLKQKAKAVGFGDIYTHALQDAPSHLHGSWKDLTEYHLTNVGDEHYRAKLAWTEPNPRTLVSTSMLALVVTQSFADVVARGPLVEELQKRIADLFGRLRMVDDGLDKFLYKQW